MGTTKKKKEWTRSELIDLQKQLDERKWYQGEEWWCDPSSIMNYCEGCVNKAASGCRASQAEREAFTSCALNYIRLEEERKKAEAAAKRKARAEEKKKRLAEEAARLEAERLATKDEKVDRRFLVIEEETSLSQNEAVDATTGETVEVVPAAAQSTPKEEEKKKREGKKKSKSKKHYVATVEEFELDV